MTPQQLLRRLNTTAQACEVPSQTATLPTVMDFATAAKMTPWACVKQKTCPICGRNGGTEHYYGDHPQSFFFCENKQHIFEFDDEGFADRVPL